MPRPKKGEKGYEQATRRWRETMLAKYGSKEAVHEQMVKMGRKGGRNGHTGGFAANPELAKIAGAIGGAKSRRKKMERDAKGKPVKKDGTHIKYTKPEPKPESKKGFLKKIFGGK